MPAHAGRTGTAWRRSALAACCAFAVYQAAWAQEPGAQPGQETGDQATDLDAVVVIADRAQTGTKTDTKLVEIPQSISVVTAEQFNDRAAVHFQDVFRYSAGVATEPNGVDTRGDMFTARGFETIQYIDGLNRTPDAIYGARLEIFTLERAEVLRGPSSVLYGAGGAGGLFNAVSKTPKHQFGGEVGVVFGSDSRQELRADVTGELSETFAGRLVALARDAELQWDGQKDDRVVVMPSLSWSPGADTTITLLGLYQKDDQGTQTYFPMSVSILAPPEERLQQNFFLGDKAFNHMDNEYRAATLLIDHAFGDRVKFSSRTRYYDQKVDYAEVYATNWAPPGPVLPREFYILDETYDGLNSDNNFAFNFRTGPFEHRVLAGIDYTLFKQDRREGFSCAGYEGMFGCFEGGSPPPLDVNNPDYYADFDYGFTNAYTTRSTQLGVYLQDQIRYADRVSLVLGVRRDRSTSEASGVKEPDNKATTFRAGVIGEVGAGFSPYVSYSESFLPVFGGDYYGNPFKPREGRQYEAGVKWQPDPAALVTLSVFDIEESNYVMQDPDFLQNFIQTGKVGSEGFEIEAALSLGGVDVNASYSYTDATILSSTDGTQGNRVAALPQHLASVWLAKSFQLGDDVRLRIGGGARYTGDRIDDNQIYFTKAVTVADAMVELEFSQWRFSINAANLFDRDYYSYCTMSAPPNGTCYTSARRTFLASLRYLF